jgi:hypothetical protein
MRSQTTSNRTRPRTPDPRYEVATQQQHTTLDSHPRRIRSTDSRPSTAAPSFSAFFITAASTGLPVPDRHRIDLSMLGRDIVR